MGTLNTKTRRSKPQGHDSSKTSSSRRPNGDTGIIRPAKRHLLNEPWNKILNEVWIKPTNGEYFFKKAHAYSYAVAVVVHMNLLCETFTS